MEISWGLNKHACMCKLIALLSELVTIMWEQIWLPV